MSEEPRGKSSASRWTLWLALALVVYVLSFGPVVAVINGPVEGTYADMPSETLPQPLKLLYNPLLELMYNNEEYRAGVVLSHYCMWWTRLGREIFPWTAPHPRPE